MVPDTGESGLPNEMLAEPMARPAWQSSNGAHPDRTRPLDGIRVLELTRILAGPWCGQLLADLGADVIKIERPGSGDDTRHWGPPFVTSPGGDNLGSAYFHSTNRGKRSFEIDIASPTGQEIVHDLIREADIVIETFKAGALPNTVSIMPRWRRSTQD